jgi:hypothetical protein
MGQAEFRRALVWLREAATCLPAEEALSSSDSESPEAIILFQARPGSLSQSDIERLHRKAPLARLIVVAGSWCEGELRSGRPPQGVARLLWHQWNERLPQELGIVSGQRIATAPRGRTLTSVDRLLHVAAGCATSQISRGQADVFTSRRERFEALADFCSAAGFQATQRLPGSSAGCGAAICLADGWASLPDRADSDQPNPPVMLLLDWPRPDDLDRAEQLGVACVLGLPLVVTDFLAAVDQLLPPHAAAAAAEPAA